MSSYRAGWCAEAGVSGVSVGGLLDARISPETCSAAAAMSPGASGERSNERGFWRQLWWDMMAHIAAIAVKHGLFDFRLEQGGR